MSPSIASTKSTCLMLALATLTTSSSAGSLTTSDKLGGSSLGSATIVSRLPIYMPALTPTTHVEDDHDTTAQRNASVYSSEDSHHNGSIEDNQGFELPEELADMIANAKRSQRGLSSPALASGAAATFEGEVRYYPTYTEGNLCSSKPIADFESWEELYTSLADCCDAAFSWDYDACVGL